MKAAVLAGGQEYGQCPLARQMPRALWPLVDRPILEHVLTVLRNAGIGETAIAANGCTRDIAERLGRHPVGDITIHYNEDSLPRGAAGCVKDCEEWLGDGTFLAVQGAAVLLNVDFQHLIEEHRRAGAVVTIAAVADGGPHGSGDEGSLLKPSGIYVCEPEVFSHISCRGYQDMKEQLIPRLAARGLKVHAAAVRGRVIQILNEECYLNAMMESLDDEEGRQELAAHLPCRSSGLWIDPGASIDPRARIVAPAYIGAGATLMQDAVVVGPALVGPGCRVGADALVHESILWQGAEVGRGAIVEHAVMAAGAIAPPGAEIRRAIVLDCSISSAGRHDPDHSMESVAGLGAVRQFWRKVWSSIGVHPAG